MGAVLIFSVFALTQVAGSKPRLVGDGAEYLLMADRLAHFEAPRFDPSRRVDDEQRFATLGGDFAGRIQNYSGGGRTHEFFHFWFYPLLVAPFMRLFQFFGGDSLRAFAVVNLVLLGATVWIVQRTLSKWASLLLVMGPVIWWIDKPHAEVFMFCTIAIAVAFLPDRPGISAIALAFAATQNLPVAAAAAGVGITALIQERRWRSRTYWLQLTAAGLICCVHPLYYKLSVGVLTPQQLNKGFSNHLPSFKELAAPLFDLNIGLVPAAPVLALVVIAGWLVLLSRRRATLVPSVGVVIMAIVFLFSFAQTANINSGGTPNMSRYAVWLIPLGIPALAAVSRGLLSEEALAVLTGVSCLLAVVQYRPGISESGYVYPTPLAAFVWGHAPSFDNPLVEVFFERISHTDQQVFFERTSHTYQPAVSIATPTCSKVLVVHWYWPVGCPRPHIPTVCAKVCYANRADKGRYHFVRANVGQESFG